MPKSAGALWRDQPEETMPVPPPRLQKRRARDLAASTRAEILTCLFAALFLVLVLGLRMHWSGDRVVQLGLALVAGWVVLTAYRFRGRIRVRKSDWEGDPLAAAPSQAFYRAELERRRDHLRSGWLWHGPLVLACFLLFAVAARNLGPNWQRLQTVVPLVVLLVVWVGWGIRQRRRKAAEIQREIDEIARW
jgi:Flp pilus assembly protein TadB